MGQSGYSDVVIDAEPRCLKRSADFPRYAATSVEPALVGVVFKFSGVQKISEQVDCGKENGMLKNRSYLTAGLIVGGYLSEYLWPGIRFC
jgi:hypothetical protein